MHGWAETDCGNRAGLPLSRHPTSLLMDEAQLPPSFPDSTSTACVMCVSSVTCSQLCGALCSLHLCIWMGSGMDCGNRAGMLSHHLELAQKTGGTVAAIFPCIACVMHILVLIRMAMGCCGSWELDLIMYCRIQDAAVFTV